MAIPASETLLLIYALVAVIVLIILIARYHMHPFVALLLASGLVGFAAGLPLPKMVASFQKGFGDTLGFVGIVLALGTMLGKLMVESGGADQIAATLLRTFGERKVHWAMMIVAVLVGLPLFFEVGFILLIPLVFTVARRVQVPVIKIGIALLAGLSVMHGLVPPHPGPLISITAFHADIGRTILYGLVVGIPTVILAGPVFGALVARHVPVVPDPELMTQLARPPAAKDLPGFGATLVTVLAPVFLMLLKSFADLALPDKNPLRNSLEFIGNPIIALLIALLLALYTFGHARGFRSEQVARYLGDSLAPIAGILVIIGAGGGFKQMLVDSGVGNAVGHLAVQTHMSPLLLAWLVAALIRVATGSATVATVTGAGLVAPLTRMLPGVNLELMVLATGAGSLILSHVNDAGFWLVKQYFNMTIAQTFKTWTAMETIISVVALLLILLLSMVV